MNPIVANIPCQNCGCPAQGYQRLLDCVSGEDSEFYVRVDQIGAYQWPIKFVASADTHCLKMPPTLSPVPAPNNVVPPPAQTHPMDPVLCQQGCCPGCVDPSGLPRVCRATVAVQWQSCGCVWVPGVGNVRLSPGAIAFTGQSAGGGMPCFFPGPDVATGRRVEVFGGAPGQCVSRIAAGDLMLYGSTNVEWPSSSEAVLTVLVGATIRWDQPPPWGPGVSWIAGPSAIQSKSVGAASIVPGATIDIQRNGGNVNWPLCGTAGVAAAISSLTVHFDDE